MKEIWDIGFTDVYETMLGLREEEAQVPWVENAFEDGFDCALFYEEMRQAYERICDRLGVGDEDEDLNIIVDSMERIQKELCFRMVNLAQAHFIGDSEDELLKTMDLSSRKKK